MKHLDLPKQELLATPSSLSRPGSLIHRAVLAPLTAALILSGCMSLAPHYERPATPVAEEYPTSDNSSITANPAAKIEWQNFFADPQLKNLIAQALEHNRDLRIAVLNIQQARALYQVREADLFPSINAAISAQREPSTSGKGQSNTYLLGLAVTSYEFDFFGRIRSLSQSALAQYLATAEARKNVQIGLVAAVANNYLALLADNEQLKLTEQTLKTREEQFKLTKLKFDQGVISELDIRQTESLLESARATSAELQRQRARDYNALTLLVGQPLQADVAQGASLNNMQLSAPIPAGLPSDLLVYRPDIRAAEQQLIAANANIGAARAAFFPNISLTASAGLVSSELSDLFTGKFAWSVGAQLLQPIFNAGRNRGNLEVAQAQKDIAIAQYERSIQTAFREVADALAGQATFDEQLRAQRAQTEAETRRFNLSDLRYRNGATSYLELLDAQRTLFAAQQASIEIQLAQMQNQVNLYKALGGGWMAEEAELKGH